jgi:hypothetical protein
VLNGVDVNGNLQTGLAIDVNPYLLFFGEQLTLSDYRKNYGTRAFARTALSLATVKGSSEDDKSARLAFGARWTIWDEGDPRLDKKLTDCFNRELQFPPLDPNLSLDEREKQLMELKANYKTILEPKAEECRQESRWRNWNASAWDIGVAPTWTSVEGTVDDLKWSGVAVSAAVAYGFRGIKGLENRTQLILQARYRTDEKVPDPTNEGEFFTQDSLLIGSRVRFGSPSLNFSIEALYIHADPHDRGNDNSYRVSVGAEFKVSQDLWIELAIGGSADRDDTGSNQAFILGQLKWGVSDKPQLQAKLLEQAAGIR